MGGRTRPKIPLSWKGARNPASRFDSLRKPVSGRLEGVHLQTSRGFGGTSHAGRALTQRLADRHGPLVEAITREHPSPAVKRLIVRYGENAVVAIGAYGGGAIHAMNEYGKSAATAFGVHGKIVTKIMKKNSIAPSSAAAQGIYKLAAEMGSAGLACVSVYGPKMLRLYNRFGAKAVDAVIEHGRPAFGAISSFGSLAVKGIEGYGGTVFGYRDFAVSSGIPEKSFWRLLSDKKKNRAFFNGLNRRMAEADAFVGRRKKKKK